MPRKYIPKQTKQTIINRAFQRCEYCQSWMKYAIHPFNIDHITPLDKGGESELENLPCPAVDAIVLKPTRLKQKIQ